MDSKVSVILQVYDGAKSIEASLRSLLERDFLK